MEEKEEEEEEEEGLFKATSQGEGSKDDKRYITIPRRSFSWQHMMNGLFKATCIVRLRLTDTTHITQPHYTYSQCARVTCPCATFNKLLLAASSAIRGRDI